MNEECEICHEHALNCICKVDDFFKKSTKGMFLDFLISAMNELAPNDAPFLLLSSAREFIDKWVDEHFKDE